MERRCFPPEIFREKGYLFHGNSTMLLHEISRVLGVELICGTPAEPAEPREITSFFATYIPGIRLQVISLLCIDPDFFFFFFT